MKKQFLFLTCEYFLHMKYAFYYREVYGYSLCKGFTITKISNAFMQKLNYYSVLVKKTLSEESAASEKLFIRLFDGTSWCLTVKIWDNVCVSVLSYAYATTSVGSRQSWRSNVFLRRKAAAN